MEPAMPKGIPLTESEQATRKQQIFEAAVELYVQKGVQETSMRAIAQAAGMGKSTLYDYFKSKEDILLFVLEQETEIMTDITRRAAQLDLPAVDRLRKIMFEHAAFIQQNHSLFLRLSAEAQRLNAHSQRAIQQRRYAFQDLVRGVIEEGIQDGSFRPVDALLAARLLINSLLAVHYTTRPTGTIADMLQETVNLFLYGLAAPQEQA
jgi:AcrR family transcriptional regulator